jgi:hypothetical protein
MWSSGFSGTVGFRFTDTAPAVVTSLGVYDFASDGLIASHEIGLWSSSGVLLASATVPAGTAAPIQNGFRYVALATPILLVPNQSYDVGAFFGSDDSQAIRVNGFATDSTIQYEWSDITGSASLVQPHGVAGSIYDPGVFGPGLLLASVPEPSTLAAMMVGGSLLALLGVSRRQEIRSKQVIAERRTAVPMCVEVIDQVAAADLHSEVKPRCG